MSDIKELEKEIKENLFQLNKDELKIIIRHIQSMINKVKMIDKEKFYKEKYKEIFEALVGVDGMNRYSHLDVLSYIHNLKNIEERHYASKKT